METPGKVVVTVGQVTVKLEDVVITLPQINRLITKCASIALALQPEETEETPADTTPFGFSMYTQIEPTVMASTYYEDEE